MLEFLIKLVAKKLANINNSTFDKVVSTVSKVGTDPQFESGLSQAEEVVRRVRPDFNLDERAMWIVRTVVQLAYTVARLKNLPT